MIFLLSILIAFFLVRENNNKTGRGGECEHVKQARKKAMRSDGDDEKAQLLANTTFNVANLCKLFFYHYGYYRVRKNVFILHFYSILLLLFFIMILIHHQRSWRIKSTRTMSELVCVFCVWGRSISPVYSITYYICI